MRWIVPFVGLACLVLSCRSRTPEVDKQKGPIVAQRIVIQVDGMTKVEGLT